MEAPSQVGNGENYPSSDSPDRGDMPARLILGVGEDAVWAESNVRFDPLVAGSAGTGSSESPHRMTGVRATNVFSRGPLSSAYRPFRGPGRKVAFGSN